MPVVEFYIGEGQTLEQRNRLACELLSQAYEKGEYVFVKTESSAQAAQFDQLLWTFDENSFIPHSRIELPLDKTIPIVIAPQLIDSTYRVCFNLSNSVPEEVTHYEKLIEFVYDDSKIKSQMRDRYRFYQAQGYEIKNYNVPG